MAYEIGEYLVSLKNGLSSVAWIIGVVCVAAITVWVVWQFVSPQFDNLRNRDNREVIDFHTHFDLDPTIPVLVFEGQRITEGEPPIIFNDIPFLPVDFIRHYIDPFMMWDASVNTLFVSTNDRMLSFQMGELRSANGIIYVPYHLVMRLYPFSVAYDEEYNIIVVTNDRISQSVTTVTTNAPLRYRPDITAPMMKSLDSGKQVTLVPLPDNLNIMENFTRVRTTQGLLGYVLTASLGVVQQVTNDVNRMPMLMHFIDNTTPPFRPRHEAINLIWEWVYHYETNALNMAYPLPESINVISPTWFRFNAERLLLDSSASAEYVTWAHEQGVQVWPSVIDMFAGPVGIQTILSNANARSNIINQLADYVTTYHIDGLTIHIEHIIDPAFGMYYIQFLRELNIALGNQVTILVTMLPDINANAHYRHDLVAQTVDFVALMTYNEHGGNSPYPGPVASITWVEQQIRETLRYIPAQQLLMGLPFFNRVWRTGVADNQRRTPLDWDMDRALWEFENREVTFEWDELTGNYYAEFAEVVDGETLRHQLWRECKRSLHEKMELFSHFNLAGIAGWNMGFTNDDVWDVLAIYFPLRQVQEYVSE